MSGAPVVSAPFACIMDSMRCNAPNPVRVFDTQKLLRADRLHLPKLREALPKVSMRLRGSPWS